MNLSTSVHEGYTAISVEGRLTAAGAAAFKAAVQQAIEDHHPRIVIDLSDATFMDSSGLGAVVGSLKSARLAGGDLRLAAVPESVATVLKLTNLDRVLRMYSTPETAFDGDE